MQTLFVRICYFAYYSTHMFTSSLSSEYFVGIKFIEEKQLATLGFIYQQFDCIMYACTSQ